MLAFFCVCDLQNLKLIKLKNNNNNDDDDNNYDNVHDDKIIMAMQGCLARGLLTYKFLDEPKVTN